MFSFLKNAALNLERVSLLSGYVGIQIKSCFFSNKDLSFDFFSRVLKRLPFLPFTSPNNYWREENFSLKSNGHSQIKGIVTQDGSSLFYTSAERPGKIIGHLWAARRSELQALAAPSHHMSSAGISVSGSHGDSSRGTAADTLRDAILVRLGTTPTTQYPFAGWLTRSR